MAKTQDEILKFISDNYGAMSAFFTVPEIRDLIMRAAKEEYSEFRLMGELQKTEFWKQLSASQREWKALELTDPASATAQKTQRSAEIRAMISQAGVTLSESSIGRIAQHSLAFGWNETQIRQAVSAHVDFSKPRGGVLGVQEQLRDISRSSWVELDDKTLGLWTARIFNQEATEEDFTGFLRDRAKGLFPHWQKQLEAGADVGSLVAPYLNLAAKELEKDPDTLLGDTRIFQPILGGQDLSLQGFLGHIRTLSEWKTTGHANQLASDWLSKLGSDFGQVAL